MEYWPFLYDGLILKNKYDSSYWVIFKYGKNFIMKNYLYGDMACSFTASPTLRREDFCLRWTLDFKIFSHVPKNNQGREFCFFCNKKNKKQYVEFVDSFINYCPNCLR